MRNLKRALSLALASVMLVGMMVVGTSAASYPDVDDSHNTEAIEVLKAVDVMIGNENGDFEPEKPVTRAEMAVVMANMLGLDAKDFGSYRPFNDVPEWAANYVAACEVNGIVSGRGDGIYDPNSTVTATEAASMMMRALGYFQNKQDYGDDWAKATVQQAAKIRLFDGITTANNDSLNRNQVAQLALNTLESDVVDFNGSLGMEIDMGDGKKVNVGYNAVYDPKSDNGSYNYAGDEQPDKDNEATHQYLYLQLCEQLYDNKLKKIGGSNDEFGRPATEWRYKGEEIVAASTEPVVTFTKESKEEDIFKALGVAGISGSAARYVVMDEIWENGVKVATAEEIGGHPGQFQATGGATGGYNDTVIVAKGDSSNAAGFGNGISVEVYEASKSNHYIMVIVKSSVGKVNSVTENKSGDLSYSISGLGTKKDYADAGKDDEIELYGDVAKGDYVTYAVVKGVARVWPTETITGTQSALTTKNVITVSGEDYTIGTGVVGVDPSDFKNSDNEAVYYIDRLGYVVKTTSSVADDYTFIVGTNGSLSTSVDGNTPKVEVRAVLSDGTVGKYDVEVQKLKASDVASGGDYAADGKYGATASNTDLNGTITFAAGDYVIKGTAICVYDASYGTSGVNNTDATVRKAAEKLDVKTYAYSLDDKTMTLEPVDVFSSTTAANTTYSVTLNTAKLAKDKTSYTENGKSILVDRDTKFVVYNTDKKDDAAVIYVGATGLPKAIDAKGLPGYAILDTGSNANTGTASLVFVKSDAALTDDSTTVYVYVDKGSETQVRVDGKNKYTYKYVTADGTEDNVSAPGDQIAESGLFFLKDDDTIGDAVSGARFIAKGRIATGNDQKMVSVDNNNWYNITEENTNIIYIDDVDLEGATGYIVRALKDGNPTSDVETLFVVKYVAPAVSATITNRLPTEIGKDDSLTADQKLTAVLTGAAATGYQWKSCTTETGDYTSVASGGNNADYTPAVTAAGTTWYLCEITYADGTKTTDPVKVEVKERATAPTKAEVGESGSLSNATASAVSLSSISQNDEIVLKLTYTTSTVKSVVVTKEDAAKGTVKDVTAASAASGTEVGIYTAGDAENGGKVTITIVMEETGKLDKTVKYEFTVTA